MPVHSLITVLIHNSGHFGPLYRFGSLGPPASYATGALLWTLSDRDVQEVRLIVDRCESAIVDEPETVRHNASPLQDRRPCETISHTPHCTSVQDLEMVSRRHKTKTENSTDYNN